MATYYVDATGGSDANDGLSTGDAWQTIAKVNGETFVAGDSILFKRGETWTGTALVITWSGAAGSPITFADYGSGAKPVIDGADTVNCVYCSGISRINLCNIEATQGLDAGFHFDTSDHINIVDCDAHDAGNDNLIFITSCHDCTVTGGQFYNAYQRTVGPQVTGIEVTNGSHDITISGVICYDNAGSGAGSGMGISIHSHVGTGMPYNVTIRNAACYGNSYSGIHVWKQDNTADSDRAIELVDCHTYDNGESGVRIHKSAGAGNFVNGVFVDSCYSHGNTTYAYYLRGDNLQMQRSVLNGQGTCVECTHLSMYNNVFLLTTAQWLFPVYVSAARTDHIALMNNIIYRSWAAGGEALIGVDATVTSANINIDYNLYYLVFETANSVRWNWKGANKNWANWKADSGMDTHSPAADQDPLFIDVANANFKLKRASPALNVGTDVGLPHYGAAPDCGRWEMRKLSHRTYAMLAPRHVGL